MRRPSSATAIRDLSLRVLGLVTLASLVAGCAATHSTRPIRSAGDTERALADAASDAEIRRSATRGDADAALDEFDRSLQFLSAVGDENDPLGPGSLDEPEPGEWVEPSPLDEIADTPPAGIGDLEDERDLLEAGVEPVFDFPVEVNDKVLAYVNFFTGRHRDKFQASLDRSGRYVERLRAIFAEEGIPQDLVYMAHVESAFKVTAYSRAKAKGIFQFIAGTGLRYGMRIDSWIDERSDPERSARAAAAYLRDLYGMFGDWYLALAAYNTGEGRVARSIHRLGPVSFWDLARTRSLFAETKNYVPAILAATLIAKQPEKYGFTTAADPPVEWETVEVPGAIHFDSVARVTGIDAETLRNLNPHLRRQRTPPGESFPLRVPPGAGDSVRAAVHSIPASERVADALHKVRRGETLSAISRRYGVSISEIQHANGMGRRTLLRVGQSLVIPGAIGASTARVSAPPRSSGDPVRPVAASGPAVHRVRRGDTLSAIARRYGSSVQAIASANGIGVRSTLRVGQQLRIPGGSAASSVPTSKPTRVVHTVRRGENLWRIAGRYRVTVDDICALNDITPDVTLYPGTRLTIRSN